MHNKSFGHLLQHPFRLRLLTQRLRLSPCLILMPSLPEYLQVALVQQVRLLSTRPINIVAEDFKAHDDKTSSISRRQIQKLGLSQRRSTSLLLNSSSCGGHQALDHHWRRKIVHCHRMARFGLPCYLRITCYHKVVPAPLLFHLRGLPPPTKQTSAIRQYMFIQRECRKLEVQRR